MAFIEVVFENGEPVEYVRNAEGESAAVSQAAREADWMGQYSTQELLNMSGAERSSAAAYSVTYLLPPEVASQLEPGTDPYASIQPHEVPSTPFPPIVPHNPQPINPVPVSEGDAFHPGTNVPIWDVAPYVTYLPPGTPGGVKVLPVLADVGGGFEPIITQESTTGIEPVRVGQREFWL